jgi:gamma-glutamylcyclotransferase (GGCT)/AIG2-like uncharacterized protein YtfP
MEMDEIIQHLNEKNYTFGTENDLTEAEKAVIQRYCPEKALIVYGTLAPGKPNHFVVEHIKGDWQKGIVKGRLFSEGWGADMGYPGFKHSSKELQETISAHILFSDELVKNWPMLDDFEGVGYKRVLAKFELENGIVGVGNIYSINEASF